MMSVEITTIKRIQSDPNYYYAVEDIHLDVGCEGFTISYHEDNGNNNRIEHMCFGKEEAVAIANAILELAGEPRSYAARC